MQIKSLQPTSTQNMNYIHSVKRYLSDIISLVKQIKFKTKKGGKISIYS
jgi:hypothetical protein